MQAVIETPFYLGDAKAAGMTAEERQVVVDMVAANPKAGDLIVGAGGARKVRVAGRGKGKSGGYRVIIYYGGDDIPVFLLVVFGKGEKANVSKAERNELAVKLATMGGAYRASIRTSAALLKRR